MDRHKDEFLATLAHELRNPLAPIRNALQVMRIARNDPTALESSETIIDRQVQQMVHLIDDLLDLSRISRGKIDLRKERIDLADVLKSAVETSRPVIDEYRHELNVNLPSEPIPLDADLVRLAQVFLNLLNNAAKYTERGGRLMVVAERELEANRGSSIAFGYGIEAEAAGVVGSLRSEARGLRLCGVGVGKGESAGDVITGDG